MPKRLSRQQCKKRLDGQCYFCQETDYDLLDVHRILEGSKGGTYHDRNTVTVCSKCHRKIHSGRIKIFGKYFCAGGAKLWVLHCNIDGEEKWF